MNAAAPRSWVFSAAWGLGILAFINLFNYLDRFLVSALLESLKHSELALSDAQLGLLASAFLVVYTFAAPVFGALGDARARPRLIAFGVACWSVATALSGLAGSFAALLAARATVGVGEAAYGTIAPSLLADYFPEARRARVMAIFFCAIPVGSALGFVVGGLVDAHYGWRAAFFVAGVPGLVLAALCLRLYEPRRGGAVPDVSLAGSTRATYRRLLANRAYRLTVLGYAAYTFGVGGLAWWMPAFLERVRGIPKSEATVSFGAIVVVTGFVGTFTGGWLGDYAARRTPRAHLWLCGVATLAAAPFVWAALTTRSTIGYTVCMVMAQFLIFLSTGPVNAALVNLVAPLERASAIALSVFSIHLLGDALSPYLIGTLSDATSLEKAVLMVPVAVLIAGVIWCWAARAQPLTREDAATAAA